jgi:hypothetical protein
MSSSLSRLSIVVALAGLLALVAGTTPARAFPPGAKAAAASSSPYAAQINALKAARTLLHDADHDYNGHRAEAVKLVTAAIHALAPPQTTTTHAKGNAAKAGAGQQTAKTTGNTVSQAVSDGMLKQAMTAIATVQTQLAGAGTGAPATAAAALQKAVQELQVALQIK